MEVVKLEFLKIITSKVLWGLTLVFILFNVFIIYEKSYIRDDLKILNEIIDEEGVKIDSEMMKNFKELYSEEKDDNRNTIIEGYYNSIPVLEEKYNNIDVMKMAENTISKEGYDGEDAEKIREKSSEFNRRFEEIKENKEEKYLFFSGINYRMHSFLFSTIFGNMNYEIAIIVVLLTTFILNYEFDNRTSLTVYSTKKGRNIIKDKLLASILSTLIFTTVILVVTLGVFFMVFDYSRVWGTSINSFFNWENQLPYISWFNLTIAQYLGSIIGIIYILQLIFLGITFILCKFIRSTYKAFTVFFIVYGIGILLPEIMNINLKSLVVSVFTPFTLAFNLSTRFMGFGMIYPMKYYEMITLSIWIIGVSILGYFSIKSFKRESIN